MQCATKLKSNEDHLNFRIESTQLQEGGVDCDLFAIAYATEFCFGNNPECYIQVNANNSIIASCK